MNRPLHAETCAKRPAAQEIAPRLKHNPPKFVCSALYSPVCLTPANKPCLTLLVALHGLRGMPLDLSRHEPPDVTNSVQWPEIFHTRGGAFGLGMVQFNSWRRAWQASCQPAWSWCGGVYAVL